MTKAARQYASGALFKLDEVARQKAKDAATAARKAMTAAADPSDLQIAMINSADADNLCNVRYGVRIRNGVKQLVLVTLRRIAPGDQLLARDYMEKVVKSRKRKR